MTDFASESDRAERELSRASAHAKMASLISLGICACAVVGSFVAHAWLQAAINGILLSGLTYLRVVMRQRTEQFRLERRRWQAEGDAALAMARAIEEGHVTARVHVPDHIQ